MKSHVSLLRLLAPFTGTKRLRAPQVIAIASLAIGSPLFSADWTSTTDQDWNTGANWSGGVVPVGENAVVNLATNFPIITADTPLVNDTIVGIGGATGRVDHRSGTHGNAFWTKIGDGDPASNGTYNLADTSTTGPGITGFGQGSGTHNGTSLRVGLGGGTALMNVHTTGSMTFGETCAIADNATAVMNFESGTWTVGGELWVGQAAAGNGTLNQSGGTIISNQWLAIGRDGSTGVVNLSGGTLKPSNANAHTAAIGTNGGNGTVNQTGGTFDVLGDNNEGSILLAENGVSTGTYVQDAGDLFSNQISVGWNDNTVGSYTLNSGTATATGGIWVGRNGTATGTVALNGGTLNTLHIQGGTGTGTVTFNGTTVRATGASNTFLSGNIDCTIDAGGVVFDSNGFNLSGDADLQGSGNLTKNGAGILRLLGDNHSYTGTNTVNAGGLVLAAGFPSFDTGDVTVANGTSLGVTTLFLDDQLSAPNVSFLGTATTLNINLGNAGGFNPSVAALDASTNLDLNGTVTLNVIGSQLAVGTFPLVSYAAKTGSGAFGLGTLPLGVQATLNDNGTDTVELVVTSVNLPSWTGDISSEWNTTTQNWYDVVSTGLTTYSDGDPVLFGDGDPATTTDPNPLINLDLTVLPSEVLFDNAFVDYTLGGSGDISGSTAVIKRGPLAVDVNLTNTYTGPTQVEGGTLRIGSLPNGGVASPIGQSSADAANLLLAGGTLDYTGATTTTDRGFTVGANGGLRVENGLTVSGTVASELGSDLTKTGPGPLTFNNTGTSAIGNAGAGFAVSEGTVTFDGSGSQVMNIGGDLYVADTPNVQADLNISNATVNVGGWLGISRGNGDAGLTSTLNVTNSTISTGGGGGFSVGFDNGQANLVTSNFTITDTTWNNAGQTKFAESNGSTAVGIMDGTTHYTATGEIQMAPAEGAVASLTLSDTAVFQADGNFRVAFGGGDATVVVENGAAINSGGGWISIGGDTGSVGEVTIRDNASFTNAAGDFNIGDVGSTITPTIGIVNVEDNATLTSLSGIFIGKNGDAQGTINQSGGTVTVNNWTQVGRFVGASGTVNQTGGDFIHTGAGGETHLVIGDEGTGIFNVSGTGRLISQVYDIRVGQNPTADGTLNIDAGGRVITPGVTSGGGASLVTIDGGTLEANANSGNFLAVGTATLEVGGGTIDTSTFTVSVPQSFSGPGDLTKVGAGILLLEGASTHGGTTNVTAGTLGGNGSVTGPLDVDVAATLSPGNSAGTITAGDTTIDGTYEYEIDSTTASSDLLVVNGNLTLGAGSTLDVIEISPAASPVYVVASYSGTLTGTFGTVTGTPAGYTLDYAYSGGTEIALVDTSATAYDIWIDSYFPGETDPAIVGFAADPDGDGESNKLEFALGGAPNNAADGAKVSGLIGDTDADTSDELLITIAVRAGTPAFTGSPSPGATHDGCTYGVEGSLDLVSFGESVSVVTPVATGLPAAPAGYEYRTFSLDSSNGLPSKGFLRATVTP